MSSANPNRVPLDPQRWNEQHPECRRRDESESDVHAERQRPKPRETLQRAEDPRLGDVALDPRRCGDRETSDRERAR
jgi:hypothetical protein